MKPRLTQIQVDILLDARDACRVHLYDLHNYSGQDLQAECSRLTTEIIMHGIDFLVKTFRREEEEKND